MQLYEGLPIITNKIPENERNGIPHHLLGCINIDEPTWTVGTFVTTALQKIDEIRNRGRLPILVGGTHYYTQSLLFHDALTTQPKEDDDVEENDTATNDFRAKWPILEAPASDILAKLHEVDPIMANRWHPNDHRKIRRSLEIYLQTGRPASSIYAEQREKRQETGVDPIDSDASTVSGTPSSSLRTPTLILWTHCAPSILSSRLDTRVDSMLESGLLSEVETLSSLAETLAAQGRAPDTSTGIWVAIGYKEFLGYQVLPNSSECEPQSSVSDVSEPTATQNRDTPVSSVTASTSAKPKKPKPQPPDEKALALAAAIERTKAATRQYAKRQVRWIRIKLASAVCEANSSSSNSSSQPSNKIDNPITNETKFYVLDGTDLSSYAETVTATGLELVGKWLRGEAMPAASTLSETAKAVLETLSVGEGAAETGSGTGQGQGRKIVWERQVCRACDMTAVTESDWRQHLASRRHKIGMRKMRDRERKREEEGRNEGRKGQDERGV